MEVFISIPLVATDGNVPVITTVNKNVRFIETYEAPTASEIAQFPTAAGVLLIRKNDQNASTRTSRYLTSLTPTQILAAINAANSNVAGLGTSGQVALVAGTKAITIPGLTTSNLGFVQLVAPNTASLTIQYKAVCTANTLTITALVAAGTINAADISTVNYAILG